MRSIYGRPIFQSRTGFRWRKLFYPSYAGSSGYVVCDYLLLIGWAVRRTGWRKSNGTSELGRANFLFARCWCRGRGWLIARPRLLLSDHLLIKQKLEYLRSSVTRRMKPSFYLLQTYYLISFVSGDPDAIVDGLEVIRIILRPSCLLFSQFSSFS